MQDSVISGERIKQLHPKVRQQFTDFIEAAEKGLGITLRVTQAFRSISYQNGLYQQGRTKPGKIVTNAPGGSSFHNYGLAIDVVRMKDGQPDWAYNLKNLVPYMSAGMEWGGDFKKIKDMPHFQIRFGNTWQQLLAKLYAKSFITGTEFVNV